MTPQAPPGAVSGDLLRRVRAHMDGDPRGGSGPSSTARCQLPRAEFDPDGTHPAGAPRTGFTNMEDRIGFHAGLDLVLAGITTHRDPSPSANPLLVTLLRRPLLPQGARRA